MPVLPTAVSIVICDQAIVDSETGKRSLIGIFQQIRSRQFPCKHPMLHVYASVTDARGDYTFSIRLVEASTDRQLWSASLPPITIQDPLQVQEISVRIQNVTFPAPGMYVFQLYTNDQLLALRRVNLLAIALPSAGAADEPLGDVFPTEPWE